MLIFGEGIIHRCSLLRLILFVLHCSPARLRRAKSCKSCKFIPPAAVTVVLLRQQNNLQDLQDFCRASG
jgi:hypothetical protein